MPRNIKIHKVTHKFFGDDGTPAIAVGQLRGDLLYINRFENGKLIEKTWAVGACADHLTGYGDGVSKDNPRAVESMLTAWRYTFGADVPMPAWCEVHDESLTGAQITQDAHHSFAHD